MKIGARVLDLWLSGSLGYILPKASFWAPDPKYYLSLFSEAFHKVLHKILHKKQALVSLCVLLTFGKVIRV